MPAPARERKARCGHSTTSAKRLICAAEGRHTTVTVPQPSMVRSKVRHMTNVPCGKSLAMRYLAALDDLSGRHASHVGWVVSYDTQLPEKSWITGWWS